MSDLQITYDGMGNKRIIVLIHDPDTDLTISVDMDRHMADDAAVTRAFALLGDTRQIVSRTMAMFTRPNCEDRGCPEHGHAEG